MNHVRFLSTASGKTGAAMLLTAATDFLLFDRPAGLSLLLLGLLLATAMIAAYRPRSTGRGAAAVGVAFLSLLPLFENISVLSVLVALCGLSALALLVSGRLPSAPASIGKRLAGFLLLAPFRLVTDIFRARALAATRNTTQATWRAGRLLVWAMPVLLGAVFIALFSLANPIIAYWISLIDPWALLDLLDIWRIGFWLVTAAILWAFLRPRLPAWVRATFSPPAPGDIMPGRGSNAAALVFGRGAILRALLVFNLLFAVETLLDAAYLWGGVKLPNGLSHADYAHRGAYPLIATALLAAIFVLIAMRPGSATSADRLVRRLIYLWTAQNVMLVISSILRLDLYVSIYSLTYWRIAAFIWMGLVAAGLILIMVRIAFEKSNDWLLSANLATLAATLYACCFVNFASMIAHYNVTHSWEATGRGLALDRCYFGSLGPAVIPAIDRFLAQPGAGDTDLGRMMETVRMAEVDRLLGQRGDWHAWTFRGWRLTDYVIGREAQAPNATVPGL